MIRKFLYASISIGLGFFIILFCLEIFLRLWGPDWLKTRMKEVGVENVTSVRAGNFGSDEDWPVEKRDGKFVKFIPHSQFRIQHYEYDVMAHIDEWGGRQTIPLENPQGKESVVFLGDSFTFGVGVRDEETFVSLLNEKFGYRFLNWAAPGSCLSNHLDIVEFRHEELLFPRIVIFVFFVGNDLTNLYMDRLQTTDKKQTAELSPALRQSRLTTVLQSINDFVRQNNSLREIYFIQFVKSKLLILYNSYRTSKGMIRRMDDEIFQVIHGGEHFEEMMKLLDEQFERMKGLASRLNFQPVFILIPDRHQVNGQLMQDKLRYYGLKPEEAKIDLLNSVLRERFQASQIPFIDPFECLKEYQKENPRLKLYYTLDNHLTKEGHQALAQCIEPSLREILDGFSGDF